MRLRTNSSSLASPSSPPAFAVIPSRPPSSVIQSPQGNLNPAGHNRNQSFSPLNSSSFAPLQPSRQRSNSNRTNHQASSTFAPRFIKAENSQGIQDRVGRLEGENDFSGKRYVWLRDPQCAFTRGWVIQEIEDDHLLVQCDDGSVRIHWE